MQRFKQLNEFCIWVESFLEVVPSSMSTSLMTYNLNKFCPTYALVTVYKSNPVTVEIIIETLRDDDGGDYDIVLLARLIGGVWQFIENEFREKT